MLRHRYTSEAMSMGMIKNSCGLYCQAAAISPCISAPMALVRPQPGQLIPNTVLNRQGTWKLWFSPGSTTIVSRYRLPNTIYHLYRFSIRTRTCPLTFVGDIVPVIVSVSSQHDHDQVNQRPDTATTQGKDL